MSTIRFQALREASTRKPLHFEETEKKYNLFSVPKLFTISKLGKIIRELNQSKLIDKK